MLKKDLKIHLDAHGRVVLDDPELEAMVAAEDISVAGGTEINDFCNNESSCDSSINVSCANFPGHCDGSSNAGICGDNVSFDPF